MIRLLLFLMASVIAAGGTSMAENSSTCCSVDMVPIQIVNKWEGGAVTTLSAAGNGFSGFKSFSTFVSSVTEHLAAKLSQENLCLNSAESQERSLVQFAHIHVTLSKDDHRLSMTRPLETRNLDVCRISSPWMDIAIGREPVPSVRAIIRFSERQLFWPIRLCWRARLTFHRVWLCR